jgi:tRNA(Ser,Leu) C12 N-acetylase TAN1
MADSNLLITFDPAHKEKAIEEVASILKGVKENPKFYESGVPGVLLTKIENDPRLILKKVCSCCKKTPEKAYVTKKWVPIEKWCSSSIDELEKAVGEIGIRIGAKKTWKMEISKRSYEKYNVIDMIMKLTGSIENTNVNLKNPDVVVKIEILGRKAGCSLLEQCEILDTSSFQLKVNN